MKALQIAPLMLLVSLAAADGIIVGYAETPSMDPFCAS
jgi:hypothetical protein